MGTAPRRLAVSSQRREAPWHALGPPATTILALNSLRIGPPPPVAVWFSSASSTRMPVHEHSVWELNQLHCGTIEYDVGGVRGAVSAGECIFIPPHTPHLLTHASPDAALWVLELSGSLEAHRPGARALGAAFVTRPPWDRFRALGRPARKLWLRPRGAALTQATDEVLAVLAEAPGPGEVRVPAPVHEAVLRARRLCETVNDDRELAIDELARRAGISPSRLAHLFQDHVGITPLQYRNYCRVQEFIRRWDGTDRNLLQVALDAGFGSYPKFHRVFSQVCGAPPREHMNWLTERHIDPRARLGADA